MYIYEDVWDMENECWILVHVLVTRCYLWQSWSRSHSDEIDSRSFTLSGEPT